ncbi:MULTISPECIES: DUF368 domain-containing protein [Pseudoalteromonas]|uniref:Putative membrane protein n=1 Tax=Pseudoalteromonas luteoviolacea (strain 2ta16) TaxID=1353533 RepID=V4I3U6_PSEL2|nr:DUF368 domain-containing protein [Pseudoalteromonas luteoviolacea]ESP94894.1 putative membrane protein [Pseudoalteromonas luteoviolacea 2ta16]KZN33435.1 hypothetical protein N483_02155 [Pseudoalteromonas luteoviolacea NCIMB 1944]MCG7548894.1 DUF368 domain-containing protein [Pseudoalteromonas sp. Of7M-16]
MSKVADSKRDYIWLFFKGAGMGAADVVPGVSGGTIAFITGIYARLLAAIKNVNVAALQMVLKGKIKDAWAHVDGNFLLAVFGGLFTSALSLAKIITYLLDNHQQLVWSFFFGLIIASFVYIAKQVERWQLKHIASCVVGALIALVITSLSPAEAQAQPWFYFVAGSIAICAMILPGISGSFILLLLGMYGHVLNAVNDRDFALVGLFLIGCVCGLMMFSRFLSWLLARFEQVTFALLSGFLIGSLNMLWPWKKVVTTYVNSSGVEKPLMQKNISPMEFTQVTGQDAQLLLCSVLAVVGLMLILALDKLSHQD